MNPFFERRLQLQLLLILFAGLCVAGLSGLLIWDSVHNAESMVIADMGGQLATAMAELSQQRADRVNSDSSWASLSTNEKNVSLRGITEAVLRSYPGVEGGFYENDQFEGYAFPTHDNPSAKTDVPTAERSVIENVAKKALREGNARQLLRGGGELVLITASRSSGEPVVAWAMQRRSHQTATPVRTTLLAALVIAALVSVGGTLRMAIVLRRGVSGIQDGLAALEKDFGYSLPAGSGELGEIARSINRMAEVRRKLEEELRREDRLRAVGRTVAGFAHEIRNPLNGIRLSVQVLEQRLKKGAVQAEDLKLVIAEVDRMDALLGELLAFREKKKVEVAEQNVLPCLERCAELTQPPNSGSKIRLDVASVDGDVRALVDADRLTQATLNLLLNAVEAAGEKGEVQMRIARSDGQVRIEVRDSGPGLSREEEQHIFEAFYTTKPKGTGLGLAVSRQLVREMGGELIYEKTEHGTAFVILLVAAQHA
jgi:signal transduction histidine kinase